MNVLTHIMTSIFRGAKGILPVLGILLAGVLGTVFIVSPVVIVEITQNSTWLWCYVLHLNIFLYMIGRATE